MSTRALLDHPTQSVGLVFAGPDVEPGAVTRALGLSPVFEVHPHRTSIVDLDGTTLEYDVQGEWRFSTAGGLAPGTAAAHLARLAALLAGKEDALAKLAQRYGRPGLVILDEQYESGQPSSFQYDPREFQDALQSAAAAYLAPLGLSLDAITATRPLDGDPAAAPRP